jgi:tripartite-type tricarboxylate transporter receptor subunit TctC
MAGIDGLLNAAGTLELDGPPRVLNRTIKSPDRAGALVVNGTRCSAALADIPTTLEAGFADAEYPIWFGIFAPAKTPRDIIEKLHRETIKALQAPKVADKLSGLGVDPMVVPPAEFGKR